MAVWLVAGLMVSGTVALGSPAFAQTRFSANDASELAARANELESEAERASGELAIERYEEALDAWEQAADVDPTLLKAWSRIGVVLHILERSDEAVERLAPIVARNPGSAQLAHAYGINLYASGREDDAADALGRVVDSGQALPDAYFILGKYHLEREAWSDALPMFERYLELQPDDLQGLRALATIRVETAEWDAAQAALERVLELEPDDVRAHVKIGHVHFEGGRYESAATSYERALELSPTLEDVRWDLASVWVVAERCEQAVPVLDRIVEANDAHFGALYFRAECRRRLGELDAAAAEFEALVARKPDYLYGYLKLAEIAFARGQEAEAEAYLERSRYKASTDGDELSLAGKVLHALGRGEESIAVHTRLVELEPENASHRVKLGVALLRVDDVPSAIDAFETATDLDPGNRTAWTGLSAALIADASKALAGEDTARAETRLARAAELEIHTLEVAINRALLALKGERADRAALQAATRQVEIARDADPEHPMVARLDGAIALRSGRAGAAIDLMEPLAVAGTLPMEAYEDLALAYAGEGDFEAAWDALGNAPNPTPRNLALVAYRRGLEHAENGRWRRASAYFDDALENAGALERTEKLRLEFAAGITALRSERWADASRMLAEVQTSADTLSARQRKSVSRGGIDVALELTYARYRAGDLAGARNLLPKKPKGDAAKLAEAVRAALAWEAWKAGQFADARTELDALGEGGRETELLRAAVLYVDGDTKRAGERFETLANAGEVEAMLGYALYLHDVANKPRAAMGWYQRYVDAGGERAVDVRKRLTLMQRVYGAEEGS